MHCPDCKHEVLEPGRLAAGPQTRHCPACDGHWVKRDHYWNWHEAHDRDLPTIPEVDPPVVSSRDRAEAPPSPEHRRARLCPQCGHFLRQHLIGETIEVTIDHCGHCGGFWLDRGVWDAVKILQLGDDLHLVFTDTWQHKIAVARRRAAQLKLLRERFGETTLRKIQRVARWIDHHDRGDELLAYLLHPHEAPATAPQTNE